MKVGDIVKIKENYEFFVNSMKEYRGKQAKITRVSGESYKLDIDDGRWNWTDDMLESSKKYEVIVDGNTVTVKDDKGNTGIAKCSPEDKFNLSTGISLAIERLKWKPSLDEKYYTISFANKYNSVGIYTWANDSTDNTFYERGLIFRTEEEAEKAAKIMLDSIKEK